MQDNLREAVARALCFADYPHGCKCKDACTGTPTPSYMLELADAAIAAARPVIGEECAAIVDRLKQQSLWVERHAADKIEAQYALCEAKALSCAVDAIRSATQNAQGPLTPKAS
jgi:hypothetical protein